MSLQPYTLRKPWATDEDDGVVIIQTTSGLALPISSSAFDDADDADQFLNWTERCGIQEGVYNERMAEKLASEWRYVRDLECPTCETRERGHKIRVYYARKPGTWICVCGCSPEEGGNGKTPEYAIADWIAQLNPRTGAIYEAMVTACAEADALERP